MDTAGEEQQKKEKGGKGKVKGQSGPPFTLKKWNAVAMWQWDVECDTCAICRVQVMGESHCTAVSLCRGNVCEHVTIIMIHLYVLSVHN